MNTLKFRKKKDKKRLGVVSAISIQFLTIN